MAGAAAGVLAVDRGPIDGAIDTQSTGYSLPALLYQWFSFAYYFTLCHTWGHIDLKNLVNPCRSWIK